MASKAELQGVVVSAKMQKSVVVAVERRVQHAVYGKTQKRTTRFMAHNEGDDAKLGDRVAIAETRPMSARKRWAVTRVIERSVQV
ncbi:MAG: 30S ribosomal protein S17 [Acidobacteria bacterium]|nr:30S ribosomal protein S17 [Acidobacteriota bacterium]HQZ40003.1 30S ribosomal protein S17 [Vicinamibacterales bacterium]